MKKNLLLLALILFNAGAVQAKVKAIDGDSLIVDGIERRLSGIDAPEYNQLCQNENGDEYKCGQVAWHYLEQIVNDRIKCKTITIDRYKRKVSVCEVDGEDINEKMVAQGMAVAYTQYSSDYKVAEKQAQEKKLGIWQGRFLKPELFRALER